MTILKGKKCEMKNVQLISEVVIIPIKKKRKMSRPTTIWVQRTQKVCHKEL